MSPKRRFDRTQRVADLIQEAVAPIIMQNMTDKRFQFVTVTSVVVSRDLSYAKIYVSVLKDDKEEIDAIVKALNHEAKFIRHELAHAVELRIVPEIRFVYDESTAHGFHISNLIDKAVKK